MASNKTAVSGSQIRPPMMQPTPSNRTRMTRYALSLVVLRLQAQHIRASLAKEIEKFEETFDDILETTNAFLASTNPIKEPSTLVAIDRASVVKTVCHFLASSNEILHFLEFQERKTGFKADISLETQVKDAQALVAELLKTLILHLKAEAFPGKENGLVYNEDVKVFRGLVLHHASHVEVDEIPDPYDTKVGKDKLIQYWHAEPLLNPLRIVPGTPWHKFFGGLLPAMRPKLFRERKDVECFHTFVPFWLDEMLRWIKDEYERYRNAFDEHPGQRMRGRPEAYRTAMLRHALDRASTLFTGDIDGKGGDADYRLLGGEDLYDIPCAEYDMLARSRMEALNAEINDPVLAGVSLFGHDIVEVAGRDVVGRRLTWWPFDTGVFDFQI